MKCTTLCTVRAWNFTDFWKNILPPSSWSKSKKSKQLSQCIQHNVRPWTWRQNIPPNRHERMTKHTASSLLSSIFSAWSVTTLLKVEDLVLILRFINICINNEFASTVYHLIQKSLLLLLKKLHGLSPQANYTDRATAASRRSYCLRLRIKGATWSAWRIPTAVFSVF
jgi:hypothetical protein